MIDKETEPFAGFSSKSIAFLKALKKNNSKPWFEAHRREYEKHLLGPMQKLAAELGESMKAIDTLFEVRPAVDKTISRIYRDTRFSRDKSPYKSTMWITFKRPGEGWQDRPAYFFEIAPDSYRFGMGFYAASRDTMNALREEIDSHPGEFRRTIAILSKEKEFAVEGETYKRSFSKDGPEDVMSWYQRKNVYIVCNRKIDERLFSRRAADDLRSGFRKLVPLYQFLQNLSQKTVSLSPAHTRSGAASFRKRESYSIATKRTW